jgi:ABC-type transport system involved in cytochrome c biogenesis permease subunit
MKLSLISTILLLTLQAWAQHPPIEDAGPVAMPAATMTETQPEKAKELFIRNAQQIQGEPIRRLPTQHNGRIKPLDTFARELMLFVNGSYSRWGLSATQIYLNFIVDPVSPFLEFIEVRSPELREKLGSLKTKRYFSLADIEVSPLQDIAGPIFQKEEKNKNSLTEYEKKVLETFHQYQALKMAQSGDSLFRAADFSFLKSGEHTSANSGLQDLLKEYLRALNKLDFANATVLAGQLLTVSKQQEAPEILAHAMNKLDLEVFYNDSRFFLIACILYLLLGSLLFFPKFANKFAGNWILAFYALPLIFQISAIGMRVYITKFAPVTSMYGTMIWVSLGVNIFSALLYLLYKNRFVSGLMLLGSGLILLLTEKTPLVLSPDMDPIVAVLRSNYWLSTHVTTITISYAAFTIAMILGNWALIRVWTHKDNAAFFKEYAHYAYRMIQLGCFLLTVGIILGGIWADESWGRFWGWDPKETWALIADLGFLAILHARYAGWVKDFSLLAWSPIAYLLVVMAWYGVNFILAAGLHSYGFSSGGATLVAIFVGVQLLLLVGAFAKLKASSTKS